MAFLPLSALGGLVGGERAYLGGSPTFNESVGGPQTPIGGGAAGIMAPRQSAQDQQLLQDPAFKQKYDAWVMAQGPGAADWATPTIFQQQQGGPTATTPYNAPGPNYQPYPGGGPAQGPPMPFHGAPGDQIAHMYRQVSGGAYTPSQQDIAQWGPHPDAQYLQQIGPAIQQWWNQNKGQNPTGAQPGGDVYGPSAPYGGSAWGQRPQFGGQGGFLPLSAFAGGWGGMFGGRR